MSTGTRAAPAAARACARWLGGLPGAVEGSSPWAAESGWRALAWGPRRATGSAAGASDGADMSLLALSSAAPDASPLRRRHAPPRGAIAEWSDCRRPADVLLPPRPPPPSPAELRPRNGLGAGIAADPPVRGDSERAAAWRSVAPAAALLLGSLLLPRREAPGASPLVGSGAASAALAALAGLPAPAERSELEGAAALAGLPALAGLVPLPCSGSDVAGLLAAACGLRPHGRGDWPLGAGSSLPLPLPLLAEKGRTATGAAIGETLRCSSPLGLVTSTASAKLSSV